jgi:hypothetical protein
LWIITFRRFLLEKKFLLEGFLLVDSLGREFSVNPGSGEVGNFANTTPPQADGSLD